MMARETATERRAREAVEAREAEARWKVEKPMRLLHAMARAHDIGDTSRAHAFMYYRDNIVLHCYIAVGSATWDDPVAELSEWQMNCIDTALDDELASKRREVHLERVRKDLLSRLTDEEKEALGV